MRSKDASDHSLYCSTHKVSRLAMQRPRRLSMCALFLQFVRSHLKHAAHRSDRKSCERRDEIGCSGSLVARRSPHSCCAIVPSSLPVWAQEPLRWSALCSLSPALPPCSALAIADGDVTDMHPSSHTRAGVIMLSSTAAPEHPHPLRAPRRLIVKSAVEASCARFDADADDSSAAPMSTTASVAPARTSMPTSVRRRNFFSHTIINRWRTGPLLLFLLLLSLVLSPLPLVVSASPLPSGLTGILYSRAQILQLRETVREMFWHSYGAYMRLAHPHDELRPLSQGWSDSLAELGNSPPPSHEEGAGRDKYQGVALTLIDSLSTLAIMGERDEFARQVDWIVANVNFDQPIRVNLFEANIRLLGGLLSAHVLATDKRLNLHPGYSGGLLRLAKDLGDRFKPAFSRVHPDSASSEDAEAMSDDPPPERPGIQLPYAWVHLRRGILPGETTEQCTAGVGTLLLEFGLLSHLTNDSSYYDLAERSLFSLWRRRDPSTHLMGNTLDIGSGRWINSNSGVGAGVDSFYEYLFKSYIFFGNAKWAHMFNTAYNAVQKNLRWENDWLVEGEMKSGLHTHVQFNSLSAFWPGLQTSFGDISSATATHARHFSLWSRFDALPERYLLHSHQLHSTEKHYILRPELMESTYLLFRATRDPMYIEMGARMVESLQKYTRVPSGGFAALRDVESKEKEDRMDSFFLAETLKYLYLLFDEENFVHSTSSRTSSETEEHTDECCPVCPLRSDIVCPPSSSSMPLPERTEWIFTTEGHVFPVLREVHQRFGDLAPSTGERAGKKSRYSLFAEKGRMNIDTRLYHRRWAEKGSVDFARLSARAHSPKVAARFRGDHAGAHAKPVTEFQRLAAAFQLRNRLAYVCLPDASTGSSGSGSPSVQSGHFSVRVSDGAFSVAHLLSGELLEIRNLGTPFVEITNLLYLGAKSTENRPGLAQKGDERQVLLRPVVLERTGKAYAFKISTRAYQSGRPAAEKNGNSRTLASSAISRSRRASYDAQCAREWDALGAFFGPAPSPSPASQSAGAKGKESEVHPAPERFSAYNSTDFLVAPLVLGHPLDGCTAPRSSSSGGDGERKKAYANAIVLLQRGGCTFMDKIFLAQESGAVGVIVINDAEAPPASSSKVASSGSAVPAPGSPHVSSLPLLMMGSDSSQRTISIPSMMVPRRFGEEILACITMHERMQDGERDARERALEQVEREGSDSDYARAAAGALGWERQPFRVEMLKYPLPSSSVLATPGSSATARATEGLSSSPASSALHPRVLGDLSRFVVTAMGGWTVEVEEQGSGGKFMLKVY